MPNKAIYVLFLILSVIHISYLELNVPGPAAPKYKNLNSFKAPSAEATIAT
jgi:hypothetical protein